MSAPRPPEHDRPRLPGRRAATAAGTLAVLAVLVGVGLAAMVQPPPPPARAALQGVPEPALPSAYTPSRPPRAGERAGDLDRPRERSRAVETPQLRSRALGQPFAGRLEGGVPLREQGATFFTWDPILRRQPNRADRRYATDLLVLYVERVLASYKAAHPSAARVGVGDLSRPLGGPFGSDFGGLGHRSHQNGLDVDLYYPRRDGRERPPDSVDQIDRRLAQDLVDRFVRAGAQFVFVGPRTGLRGTPGRVGELELHDDHMHVRIAPPRPAGPAQR
jgi:murein endopeptidase